MGRWASTTTCSTTIRSAYARDTALQELMTPGAFQERHAIRSCWSPSVAAGVIDAAVRALLTTRAALRPEVAGRLADGAALASPVVTLVDDPTAEGAYGGFAFDDEGTLATAQTLLDGGRVAGRLADRAGLATAAGRGRRPGHAGPIAPMPSHLRLSVPGAAPIACSRRWLPARRWPRDATVDPASGRVVISVARALGAPRQGQADRPGLRRRRARRRARRVARCDHRGVARHANVWHSR